MDKGSVSSKTDKMEAPRALLKITYIKALSSANTF